MPTLATRISDLATAIATAIKSKADKTAVVDLTTNQSVAGKKSFTREIVLANLASDPSSLSAGMAWLNSTEGAVKMYIGGQIVTLYRLTVGDPSALSDGLIWYDLLDNKLRLRRNGVTREISDSSHSHTFADLTGKPEIMTRGQIVAAQLWSY